MTEENKGKTQSFDKSYLMGVKPFGNIGPDRTTEETKNVVSKLKKKKKDGMGGTGGDVAEGSTAESGECANVSKAISGFSNGRK
jgi:hypothetical protein